MQCIHYYISKVALFVRFEHVLMLKLKSRPQKLALKAISLAFWIGDLGFLVVPIGVYHAMKTIFMGIFLLLLISQATFEAFLKSTLAVLNDSAPFQIKFV